MMHLPHSSVQNAPNLNPLPTEKLPNSYYDKIITKNSKRIQRNRSLTANDDKKLYTWVQYRMQKNAYNMSDVILKCIEICHCFWCGADFFRVNIFAFFMPRRAEAYKKSIKLHKGSFFTVHWAFCPRLGVRWNFHYIV